MNHKRFLIFILFALSVSANAKAPELITTLSDQRIKKYQKEIRELTSHRATMHKLVLAAGAATTLYAMYHFFEPWFSTQDLAKIPLPQVSTIPWGDYFFSQHMFADLAKAVVYIGGSTIVHGIINKNFLHYLENESLAWYCAQKSAYFTTLHTLLSQAQHVEQKAISNNEEDYQQTVENFVRTCNAMTDATEHTIAYLQHCCRNLSKAKKEEMTSLVQTIKISTEKFLSDMHAMITKKSYLLLLSQINEFEKQVQVLYALCACAEDTAAQWAMYMHILNTNNNDGWSLDFHVHV